MRPRLRVILAHLQPQKCIGTSPSSSPLLHLNHTIAQQRSFHSNNKISLNQNTTTTSDQEKHTNNLPISENHSELSELVRNYFQDVKSFIGGESKSDFWDGSVKIPTLLSQIEQRKALSQPLLAHNIKIPDVIVSELCSLYVALSMEEKEKYFQVMALEFGVNEENVWREMDRLKSQKLQREAEKSEELLDFQHLRRVMVPLYEQFFDHLIKQPNGMQFVVSMRRDLLTIISTNRKNGKPNLPQVLNMDHNLQLVLSSWFSLAFLRLEELTWNSPIAMLEKVMNGERVHKFGDIDPNINLSDRWQDLKRRVSTGQDLVYERRRLFCFVHPNMSSEPLIFVQVAYLDQIPGSMSQVLPKSDTYFTSTVSQANTAVFYSINATQHGLRGIELGNFLIKRVVKEVLRNNPNIKQFCTLSPIPGLAKWLFTKIEMHLSQAADKFRDTSLLRQEDIDTIFSLVSPAEANNNPYEALKMILSNQQQQQAPLPYQLRPLMLRLATKYLYKEKRRDKVIDSVANFHIRNGARMYRVNLDADLSKLRLKESFGIMINYEYVLADIEPNNQAYILDGTVKASEQFLTNI